MLTRRIALAVCAVALVAARPAAAQAPTTPLAESLVEQSCRSLNPGGSGGAADPQRADPSTGLPPSWAPAPAGLVPARVDLRSSTETFNRLYEFALRGGRLYAHRRGAGDPWRTVPLPACLDGRLTGISVDDDELVALDHGRRIFTMDHALKDAALWNWTSRWGPPTWTGPGFAVPQGTTAWSWSVISQAEDGTWTDPAGNRTRVGDFKVSHIWGLRTGGQRLTFWDPWLPLDESYEMCGPERGRFRAVNLSASGSHVFVVGAHGDLFTRLYDFDISGHDPVFFKYAYEDQRGKGDGAPIQLPAEPWTEQPKIPGTITSAISIAKTGADAVHGILRVEGERDGRTGYWQRDLAAPAATGWSFHATGRPLTGRRLDNSRADTSASDLGPGEDERFVMKREGVEAELLNFNVYCSPARLRIREGGGVRDVVLHHVDGLRQQARARGLDDTPREQYGAIEGPRGRFEPVTLHATRDAITLDERGWTFTRADLPAAPSVAPSCVDRRLAIGVRGIGPLRLGMTTAQLRRTLPEPAVRSARSWRWCVAGGGRLSAALVRGRVALAATTAKGHRLRRVRPGATARTIRRAYPRRRALRGGLVRTSRRGGTVLGLTRGRVRFVAVTSRATAARVTRLHARLRAAGLRR